MSEELQTQQKTTKNKKSILKNYIYNALYQAIVLIVPLITTPYISRVLGSSGVGIYSFTYSITYYFVLLGALGFGYYAQREIARHQTDKKKQTIIFWEIQICKLLSVSVALVINIILIFSNVYGDYTFVMKLMMINIISTFFDVTFIYQGNEDFKQIVLRNGFFKIVGVILIFVFVKKQSDLWIYVLCQCLILLVSNLSMWVTLPKYLQKVSVKELSFVKHIVPTLRLFIPTIAITVYTVLDRTLIGVMVQGTTTGYDEFGNEIVLKISDIENGYYEQAEKIVKLCLTFITALGAVMIPKNSFFFEKGDLESVKSNMHKAITFVFLLGSPIVFGLIGTSLSFSPWFFGPGYEKVPYLIMVFSPLVLAIGLNNAFGVQYLIPAGKDNLFTLSVVFGACLNLTLNLIFIPFLQSIGAAIASVIAEFSIFVFQFVCVRKQFTVKKVILVNLKYIGFGLIMFIPVFLLSYFVFKPTIAYTLLLVFIGFAIYMFLLILSKDQLLFNVLRKVKDRFRRRKE